jgi:hypothetical protein
MSVNVQNIKEVFCSLFAKDLLQIESKEREKICSGPKVFINETILDLATC